MTWFRHNRVCSDFPVHVKQTCREFSEFLAARIPCFLVYIQNVQYIYVLESTTAAHSKHETHMKHMKNI